MIGSSDSNRSERQGGSREADQLKEVRSKGTTVGTRTDSEAAMRAMSVLGSAKSERHRKTHGVESDGPARKFTHLTRGGLPVERWAGVSRGHSSEEARRKLGGAKGRRTSSRRSTSRLRNEKRVVARNHPGQATTACTEVGGPRRPVDSGASVGRGRPAIERARGGKQR